MAGIHCYAVIEYGDGLQMIPSNWLDETKMEAFWPDYTDDNRYNKAVKYMEEPKKTWIKHSIRKVYGKFFNYEVARRKLKEAEQLSDLNTDTEKEENHKKTRKIRAAKILNTSSSDQEVSDDDFTVDMPRLPDTKKIKNSKNCTKDLPKRKNEYGTLNSKEYFYSQDPQCSTSNKSILNKKIDNNDNNGDFYTDLECDMYTDLNNVEKEKSNKQSEERKNDEEENYNVPSTVSDTAQKSIHFQRFVIRKLITLEQKMDRLDNNMNTVKKYGKTVLQKFEGFNIEMENKENINVYDDLPLKDKNALQEMETRLKDDLRYRKEMEKQLTRVTCDNFKTSCVRLIRAVLSNDLAAQYSWYGAKKKDIFSELQICKVIMDVMRKLHANVTDEEIAGPIKIWLAHAKERLGREKATT